MNAKALTIEALTNTERMAFNAMRSVASAIGNNLVIGFSIHCAPGPDGETAVPAVTLIFHGDPPEYESKNMMLTVPKNGPTVFNLIALAGQACEQILTEFRDKTGNAQDYFHESADIAKTRRNAKPSIIIPSRS